jgi:FG-GAP-like repeat
MQHFVDVAAGLRAPLIYGGVDSKKYILESVGCGCAFVDYDNDGWMDIFVLTGMRLEGTPTDATNRLYKNNHGTFTDIIEKAGLRAIGWASAICVGDYNSDGFEDIFCTAFGHNVLYDGYPHLFMVTGNVYPEVESKLPQYANKTPRAVFRNLGNHIRGTGRGRRSSSCPGALQPRTFFRRL